MSIFNEFFKKEKPVFTGISRGVGGFGFGAGGAAAAGPTTNFSASGGTKVEASDGYTYHIFTNPNSDNLVVTGTDTKPAVVLLVGGGGGGGIQHAGGGGAGALYINPDYDISAGTYPVTIGAGGAGAPGGGVGSAGNGAAGGNSVFNDVTMKGGGGGSRMGSTGADGGSGGGGGMNNNNPGPNNLVLGGAVSAPPTTPSSSPLIKANAGGGGSAYYDHSNGGVGGGGGGAGGTGTTTPPGPGPSGDTGKGGDDYLWTGIPTPVMPEIAAGLGTPTVILGVPISQPENYKRAYGGGGAGGSHSPWGIYNPSWGGYGPHPVSGQPMGGGSGNRTGGKGGLGNNNRGQPGVEGRGGGGGGSGGSPNEGGHGGAGVCIVRYETA